jgi:CRISPR-associated protein Csx1
MSQSSVVTVYVATWGNPLNWRYVEYDCGGGNKSRGFASIVCTGDVRRYIIYALDSVLTTQVSLNNEDAYEVLKRLEEETHKIRVTISEKDKEEKERSVTVTPTKELDSLNEWRDLVKRYVESLVFKLRGSVDVRVVVTSSLGKYRVGSTDFWSYEGHYELMIMELLQQLWANVKDLIYDGVQLKLHIDLTHGVNFMPALTLYVSRLLASLALINGASSVTITAYNATPEEWRYEKVFSEVQESIVVPENPTDPRVRALMMGLVPFMHRLCVDSGEQEPMFDVPVTIDHGAKLVRYDIRGANYKKHGEYYEALLAYYACRAIRGLGDEHGLRLSGLLRENVFDKVSPVVSRLVKEEVNNIQNTIIRVRDMAWVRLKRGVTYAKLLGYRLGFYVEESESREPSIGDCRKLERHAIAHAGFLRDYTIIRECGDDYCITIDDSNYQKLLECLGLEK